MKYVHLALLSAAACLHIPSERATRDLEVGRASIEGASVAVASGLGVVRELQPGVLRIRASAPEIDIALDPGTAAERWDIYLDNVMADAQLLVDGVAATPALDTTRATERHFVVSLAGKCALALRTPDSADLEPWRFLFYADVQEAIDRVQDLYRSMNAQVGPRFALLGGDLTESGSDAELARFETETKSLQFPIYSTLGNHELGTDDGAPYQRRYGAASSSFRFRGVAFTLLDSANSTIAAEVYDRLDGWLDESRDGLHVVSMHIPPFDPVGVRSFSFSSTSEAERLLARLAAGKVDLTLYGHVHNYYAFSNAKIPAFIAGGGGANPERVDYVGRHYLVVEAIPQSQTLTTTLVRID